jgi:hypothetical protein
MIMEQHSLILTFRYRWMIWLRRHGGLHGGLVGLRQSESKPYVKMSETALKTKKQNVNPITEAITSFMRGKQ